MASKDLRVHVSLWLLLVGVVASKPAVAGSGGVIGSVAGSTDATLGGAAILPNTTVFSGDRLQVQEGVAVVTIGKSSWVVFGQGTVASFMRDANEVTLRLSQGNVSMSHPDDSVGLRVKAGEISIAPSKGFKTAGDVAMVNGAVVVTAKEGLLRVEGNGPPVVVAKGKTITLTPKAGRAPRPAGGMSLNGVNGTEVGTLVAAGVGAVFGIVATKRAGDARNAANQADADAIAAASAAKVAGSNANSVGCALDKLNVALGNQFPGRFTVSPYAPPAGFTCP